MAFITSPYPADERIFDGSERCRRNRRVFTELRTPLAANAIVYPQKMGGDVFKNSEHRQAETEQLRLDFIRTELETCCTFAGLAATELQIGDREAAEHCIRESKKACDTAIRFLSRVSCAEERQKLEKKARHLRETLDVIRQRIAEE